MAQAEVKGFIGSEKVELYGAASEATLERLVNSLDKKSGKAAKEAEKAAKANSRLAENSNQAAQEAGGLAEELDGLSSVIPSIGGAFSALGSVVKFGTTALTGLTQSAFNLADEFLTGSDRLSGLLGSLPVVGRLAETLDATVDSFREVSQVGAGFSNSLLNFRQTANLARLNLDEFQRVVTNNSDTFAQLGGTVTQGSRMFAEFSGAFRTGEIGERLMGMGMSIGEINDYLASYLEIELRRGRQESILDSNRNERAQEYIMQLDRLAKLTGEERSQLNETMKAQEAEAGFRAFAARATSEEARNRIENNFAFLKSQGELGTALMDLADGVAQTEFGKILESQIPEVRAIAQAMGEGAITAEQARMQLGRLAPRARELTETFGPETVQAFEGGGHAMATLLSEIFRFERFHKQAVDAMLGREQNAQNTITNFLASFEQTITDIRKNIEETILDTPVFAMLSSQFERLVGAVDSQAVNKALTRFEDEMMRFNRWFEGIVTQAEQEGLWPAIKTAITDIFNQIRTFIFGGDFEKRVQRPLPGGGYGTEITRETRQGIISNFAEGFSNWYETSGLKTVFQQMADDIVGSIRDRLFGEQFDYAETQELVAKRLVRDRQQQMIDVAKETGGEVAVLESGAVVDPKMAGYTGQDYDIVNLSAEDLDRMRNTVTLMEQEVQRMEARQEGMVWGFNNGTLGVRGSLLQDFGSGTPAMLHGREAVLTESQLSNLAEGVFSVGSLSALKNIDRDIKKTDNTKQLQDLTVAINNLRSSVNLDDMQGSTNSNNNATNDIGQKLDQLNNTMNNVLTVLHASKDINSKQFSIAKTMTGNMLRGVPT